MRYLGSVVMFCCVASAQVPRAVVRDGNVFINLQGDQRQITFSGLDSDARLSPDQTKVTFLRKKNSTTEGTNFSSILIVDLKTLASTELLAGPVTIQGTGYSEFLSPELSPDNKDVYFLIADYAATTGAVVEFDVATRATRFVTEGLQCLVVPSGSTREI